MNCVRSQCSAAILTWLLVVVDWWSVNARGDVERVAEEQRLSELGERFFRWRISESPEYGTLFGIHDNDDKVEEFTEAAFERQVANATSFLAEAESFDRLVLSESGQLTLEALIYNLRTFVSGYKFRRFGMYNPITPLERPTGEWASTIMSMKFENEGDYRKLLSRLRRLPLQIDQLIAMMRQAIKKQVTVHKLSLTGAIESVNRLIVNSENVSSSALYAPFFRAMRNISTEKQLKAEARTLLLGDINDAWIRFRNFIADEYSARTRPNISVSSLPGGREYYEACLRWHTTTNMTALEIFQIGLNEVERIRRQMVQIMEAEGFSGSLRDFVARMYNDSNNFFKTSEDLLYGYRDIIDKVHSKLPLILKRNPEVPVIVRSSTNPQGPSGSYQDPTLDFSKPGEFIANVFYPQSVLKATMAALTLHEAEPGHHTQAVYGMMSKMPLFRRAIEFRKYHAVPFNWPFFTAYVEGWALYAESLGEDMDIYTDRLSLFGRYASEIFRASRLVVDTGIHAFGWTKEEAASFFQNYTAESPVMTDIEINRYISWPGQACSYKIGELVIQQLKKKAKDILGDRFDKRNFHDRILELGPVPLFTLEAYIDRWIDEVKNSGASAMTMPSKMTHWTVLATMVLYFSWHTASTTCSTT